MSWADIGGWSKERYDQEQEYLLTIPDDERNLAWWYRAHRADLMHPRAWSTRVALKVLVVVVVIGIVIGVVLT